MWQFYLSNEREKFIIIGSICKCIKLFFHLMKYHEKSGKSSIKLMVPYYLLHQMIKSLCFLRGLFERTRNKYFKKDAEIYLQDHKNVCHTLYEISDVIRYLMKTSRHFQKLSKTK